MQGYTVQKHCRQCIFGYCSLRSQQRRFAMHTKCRKRILAQQFPGFCRHSLRSYQQKRLAGDASEQLPFLQLFRGKNPGITVPVCGFCLPDRA